MTLAILAIFALALAAALWLRRMARLKKRQAATSAPLATYACVSIRPGLDACMAVWMLVGNRYLPGETPTLPVAGCDKADCQCALNPHDDRREPGERRGSEENTAVAATGERRNRGRRAGDGSA